MVSTRAAGPIQLRPAQSLEAPAGEVTHTAGPIQPDIVAEDKVLARSAVEAIVAGSADQDVVTIAAYESVICSNIGRRGFDAEQLGAIPGAAGLSVDRIIAVAAKDDILVNAAVEEITGASSNSG